MSALVTLTRKPTMVLTDEGYIWVDVPVEIATDDRGKVISERFIEPTRSLATQPIRAAVMAGFVRLDTMENEE